MMTRRLWAACRPRRHRRDRPLAWLAVLLCAAIGTIALCAASGGARAGVAVDLAAMRAEGAIAAVLAAGIALAIGVAGMIARGSGRFRR